MNPFVRLHFDLICKHQRNRDLLPAVCHRFIFCPKLSTASSPSPLCLLLTKWDYTLVTTPIFCRGYLLCLSPSQKQGENPIKQQQPYTRSCSSWVWDKYKTELPDKQTTKLSFPFTVQHVEDEQKEGEAVPFFPQGTFCMQTMSQGTGEVSCLAKFHLAKENNLQFSYSFK